MADPVELVVKSKGTCVGWACAKCGAAFLIPKNASEEQAKDQYAHAKNHCDKTCQSCGAPTGSYYQLSCMDCQHKAQAAREQRWFEKAEKITSEQYDGPVVWGDEYYFSVDELLEHCENEELDVPEYVWATTPSRFTLSAEDIIDRELERQEMHEDAYDQIAEKSRKRLQEFFDVWCKDVDLVSYHCDTSRAVLLRPEDVAASA